MTAESHAHRAAVEAGDASLAPPPSTPLIPEPTFRALAESLAHLERLVFAGRAERGEGGYVRARA